VGRNVGQALRLPWATGAVALQCLATKLKSVVFDPRSESGAFGTHIPGQLHCAAGGRSHSARSARPSPRSTSARSLRHSQSSSSPRCSACSPSPCGFSSGCGGSAAKRRSSSFSSSPSASKKTDEDEDEDEEQLNPSPAAKQASPARLRFEAVSFATRGHQAARLRPLPHARCTCRHRRSDRCLRGRQRHIVSACRAPTPTFPSPTDRAASSPPRSAPESPAPQGRRLRRRSASR